MSFSALTDSEQMLVDLQLDAAQTRTDREIALADLSLMVAGLPPADAPLLSNNPLDKPGGSGHQSAPSSRDESQSRLTSAAANN
jgi:hypothetical protein